MNKKIYLATPYSHPDPKVKEERFYTINKVAARLLNQGFIVFSPISHCHPLHVSGEGVPSDWEFWKRFDSAYLEWCDQMFVFCAQGWKESVGVQAEIEIIKEMGKPIRYLPEDFLDGPA